MFLKSNCDHCSNLVEFEAELFYPGVQIDCPHCHLQTKLYATSTWPKDVAVVPAAKSPSVPPEPLKAAARTTGGAEASLETLGRVIIVLTVMGASGTFIAGMGTLSVQGGALVFFIWCGSIIVSGVVLVVVLGAFSDVIRLLKKLSGIRYTGEINSGYACSNCGCPVKNGDISCAGCKRKLEFQE